MPKIEFYLNKIIYFGLYAILLTPLVFWPRALYAFGTPKFLLFQVLVEIIFVVWVILLLKSGFTRIWTGLRSNYITLAILSFIAISFISAIFGVDFQRSFWGIGARMTGLFAELHFFAWFLVLISFFRSPTSRSPEVGLQIPKSDFNSYLNFSFFVALAVAATTFYQNAEWSMAIGSTVFNNPTFAAPYLIFHFFWGIYQTIKSTSDVKNFPTSDIDWKKWIFGAGSVFILFVIFLLQIRGAILGVLAGILLLGFFLVFSNIFSRRFKIALIAAFILIFIGFLNLWIFRGNQFIENPNLSALKRLTQFSFSEATAQTRILAWQTALKGFADRPILGAGPENFNYLFNANYDPKFLKFGGGGFGETWFDKPHNAFLEILTETGIIGGLAYLSVWFAAALALFKLFKSGQKFLSLILLSAFVAYFGAVFFSFDSFGSWFGLYLFLAFLALRENYEFRISNFESNSNYSILKHSVIKNSFKIKNSKLKILITPIIFFSTLILLYLNYSILRANIYDADALRTFPLDPAQGIVLFKKSLTYFSPYKSEYQFDLIASVAGAVEKGIPLPNLEDTVNFALGEADKAVAVHPKDAAKYTDMVRIYNIFGTKGRNPEILAQAETFGNKSLKLSPQRQETLYYLARTALLKGDSGLAVKLTKNAAFAEPSINLSHWYLGLALIGNNQRQEGTIEIKKALELGYRPKNQAEKEFIKNLGL